MPYDQGTSGYSVDARPLEGFESRPLGRSPDLGLGRLVRLVKRGGDLIYSRGGGLSGFEWRVLAEVCDAPRRSINDLALESDRSVAQVSRTVKHLVELGLVEREAIPGGHRVAISPTALGLEMFDRLSCASLDRGEVLTAGITERDLAVFQRVVSIMTRNAEHSLCVEAEASSGGNPET